MGIPANPNDFGLFCEAAADFHVVTSGGRSIPAHSRVLASASPVLEKMIVQQCKKGRSGWAIQIPGVPCDVVIDFLRFLYAGKSCQPLEAVAAMERHGVQLLALSHAYRIRWLKRRCETEICGQVVPDDAVDVMKLARLCDAPRLFRRCLGVVAKDFANVQRSEGWRFVQTYDPHLELEVVQFMEEREQRRRRWRRERVDQEVFMQLSEAMECLVHICTEGCTVVGPHDGDPPSKNRGPCIKFRTCEALQFLIRHFATCGKKLAGGGGCIQCKRMWQLFRLHSSLCDRASCKVPLCSEFKIRMPEEGKMKGDEATWRLLVKKVTVARVMSSLDARKTPEQIHRAWERFRRRN
ncbi:BTB/POZ and TAZ domain-containing protein 1 [Platanthera guangdongensis]|uniref:BTB/POZ and TAZ domain-containing protein 1 n=1 Tax=Platanthera guangdongensis TaxID=2320717 RepID=A0ABR2LLL5_9ASPA